jgi:hypothetical protein
MNTILTATDTNMSGNQQRIIKAAVRDTLTELFQQSDAEAGNQGENNLQVFLADIRASWVKHTAKAPKLFSSASTYALGAVSGKKTKKCFTGKFWYYRDNDFDNWLSADQPNAIACTVTVLTPMKDWTFVEAAVSVLNVSPDTPVVTLGKLLIERGHTMPLTKLEAMAEATERGEKTGMVTNGWGNFAFVETGNENNPVSVGCVLRSGVDRHWSAGVFGLSHVFRWFAGVRLLVCNLDPSKLGL